MSPGYDQAVSTACFNPLVQMDDVSGQACFSRFTWGISKTYAGVRRVFVISNSLRQMHENLYTEDHE